MPIEIMDMPKMAREHGNRKVIFNTIDCMPGSMSIPSPETLMICIVITPTKPFT